MLKAGEHEQWRLDREAREQIEQWEQKEKEQWEKDFYASFNEDGDQLLEPTELLPRLSDDLDEPDAVDATDVVITELDGASKVDKPSSPTNGKACAESETGP